MQGTPLLYAGNTLSYHRKRDTVSNVNLSKTIYEYFVITIFLVTCTQ